MTFDDTATRTLLAVLSQARPTVRSVATEVGKPVMTTWEHLRRLREAGLVEWEPRSAGTLRAMVAVVVTPSEYNRGHNTSDPRTADTAGGRTTPNGKDGAAMQNDTPASRCRGVVADG